jgi:hypothetical protein
MATGRRKGKSSKGTAKVTTKSASKGATKQAASGGAKRNAGSAKKRGDPAGRLPGPLRPGDRVVILPASVYKLLELLESKLIIFHSPLDLELNLPAVNALSEALWGEDVESFKRQVLRAFEDWKRRRIHAEFLP